MSKKKYGWVVYCLRAKKYMNKYNLKVDAVLRDARVCDTRQKARDYCLSGEVVRKVSLTALGKAKKIIGRG